jgi:phage terminase large subunit-like protein
LCTGRGWGKNRTQSEWLHQKALEYPDQVGFLAGRTLGGVGKAIIWHPKSGLLVTQNPANPCKVENGSRPTGITWANGARCNIHTSESPDSARGPEYAYGLADEIGTWKREVDFSGNTTWDNLQFALRAGPNPQMLAASTPRPVASIKDLLERGKKGGSVVTTTGTMYENRANLPDSFIEYIEERYAGTRLYRQEVAGELLMDVDDAILTHDQLDKTRVDAAPDLARIVIGVDPAGKSKKKSDNTGIVAAGRGVDGELYVLQNATCKLSPDGWARRAVGVYHDLGADLMTAEDNMGGEMVESVIRGIDPTVNVKRRTATRSKTKRAEPVLAFFERSQAHIVGEQTALEDQLVQFTPSGYVGDASPDDADAMVWAASELMLGKSANWDMMAAANG